jgi:hypothetical protein
MKKYLWVEDGFYKAAGELRSVFEERFQDPRRGHSERFVWDFWHVPDQYTLVRTPAMPYFPAAAFDPFLDRLADWGRDVLGCAALSPPWLSYYVDGCQQQLHSDVPHGPWAYVFSLSPRRLAFTGGETLLLRPQVLDYWRSFSDASDREQGAFVERVAPRFNRLVVFDPRIPHGVTPVRGTMDPREARLVVHGWFTEPRPCLRGALRASQVARPLDEAVGRFTEELAAEGLWHGVLSVRLKVSAAGAAAAPEILADTLVPVDADPRGGKRVRAALIRNLSGLRFPKAKAGSVITLPLLFR